VQIKDAKNDAVSHRNMQEVTTVQEMGLFESRRSSVQDYFPDQKETPPILAFNMQKKSGTVKFTGASHDFRTHFDLSYEPSLFHIEG
jgi:hypothetical protein